MVACEGLAHLLATRGHGGPVELPGGMRHAGDEVVFVAIGGGVVDHHVAVGGPPFDARLEVEVVGLQPIPGDQRAMGDPAAVVRLFLAEQRFAKPRIDAVGADHDVRPVARAVGKGQFDARAVVDDLGQALVEVQRSRVQRVDLERVQVAAVDGDIGRAIGRDGMIAERDAREIIPRLAIAAHPEIGMRAVRRNGILDADPPEDLHHVRAHVDPRAEAREGRSLLEDIDGEAGLLEERRGAGTAQACADDGDATLDGHRLPVSLVLIRRSRVVKRLL